MKYLKNFLCILLSVAMIATSGNIVAFAETIQASQQEQDIAETAQKSSDSSVREQESEEAGVIEESTEAVAEENTEAAMEESTETVTEENAETVTVEDTVTGESPEENTEETKEEKMLSWKEFCELYYPTYKNLSKPERLEVHQEYALYQQNFTLIEDGNSREKSGSCMIQNPFLEISVASNGKYTIGNKEGNPNYSSDNNEKLLYGHPDPGTSETLIKIGSDEYWFHADSVSSYGDRVVAMMTIADHKVKVIQTLEFYHSGNSVNKDTVRINYKVINNGSASKSIGVRIMLDTMLADHDDAPFKITGLGNVTTITNLSGSRVPASYQVYDDLNHPTTIATGYLKVNGERNPDRVQFTNWGGIEDSSWDYVGTAGGYLGDSAVGIYFDPVSVGVGKEISVSTYYGVSVGAISSSSTNQQVVSSKKVVVSVKDSDKGTAIADADVKAVLTSNGRELSGKTDGNGKVTLELPDTKQYDASLTIQKSGYSTRVINQTLKGGSIVSTTLKNATSSNPEITGVTVDGKDVINGVVHYIQNHNNIIEKDKNAGTAKFKVTSDMSNCTYYLIQGDSVLQKNQTGEFSLKTSKVSEGTLIESLSSGSLIYVKAVSSSGKSSKKIRLGIKVSIPSVETSSILDLDLWPAGTGNVAKDTVGALFLGDKVKFGLGKKLKCLVEVEENGMVKVGVNMTKLPKSVEDRQDIMEALSKANLSKSLKSIGKDFHPKKSSVSLGVVAPSFNIMGYGEGFITEHGITKLNVAICVEGAVDASYTVNYYYVVPLYITIGAGGKVVGEVKANLKNEEALTKGWNLTLIEGTIKPSVYLSVEGGVGSKGIASAGVEGKATLEYAHDFVTKSGNATLTGEANIVLDLFSFEKSLNLAKATKKIYDSNDREGSVAFEDEPTIKELLSKEEFKLVDHSYLNANSKEGNSDSDGMTLSAIPNAEVKTINVNGKRYRFMIQSEPGIDVNGEHLTYQVYEDGYWSELYPVEEDGTSDYFPSVAASEDGKIFIVWHNTKARLDNETVTPQSLAEAGEIRLAVMDTKNDNSLQYYDVTNNNYMDSLPAITVDQNGTAYLAWYANTGDILANDAADILCYTSFSNGILGSIKEKDLNGKYISNLSVGMIGGVATATYSLIDSLEDIDNNTLSVNTLQLNGTGSFGTLNQEENNSLGQIVMGSFLGNSAIYWYENGNIWYSMTGDKADKKNVIPINEETLENEYGISNEFSVIDQKDQTAVIWKNSFANEDESGFKIYATINKGSGWSTPIVVKESYCDNLRDLNGFWNEDGELALQYIEVCYDEDGNISSSYFKDEVADKTTDVSLEHLAYDKKDVQSATKLPITLELKNNGNQAVDTAEIRIENDYEDTSYTHTVSDLNLMPGESKNILIDEYILPGFDQNEIVTITANVDVENNQSNLTSEEFKVGYASIEVDSNEMLMIDEVEYYKIKISNIGHIDAKNINVRVLADDKEGVLISNSDIEELKSLEDSYVYISGASLEESDVAYINVSAETPLGEEESYYWPLYCARNTMLLLGNHNVKLEAENGGRVGFVKDGETSYSSSSEADVLDFSKLEISAQAEEGYVFDGWTVTKGTVEDEMSEDTIFNAVDDDVVITANFITMTENEAEVSLNKTKTDMVVGDNENLIASIDGNVTKQVIWTSSNPEIAKVSSTGKVTALKAGTVTINVEDKGNHSTASCEVTISDILIQSMKMIYPDISLPGRGAEDTVDLFVTPSNATEEILYQSDKESVVTVDQEGKLTAVGVGTATITAYTVSGVQATCQIEVENHLDHISLSKSDITIEKGKTDNISVIFDPIDATDINDVVWTNYNPDVIEIAPSGENNKNLSIKALQSGTSVIEANVNDIVTYCTVTVNAPAKSISLDKTTLQMTEGQYTYLHATMNPSDTTDTCSWSSSDSNVVSVDSDGELYARKPGKATITVQATSGVKAQCAITVTQKQYETVNVTGVNGFETPHSYASNTEKVWQYKAPNTSAIRLTFSKDSEFESGYDYLTILDANGNQLGKYTGTELAGKVLTFNTSVVRLLVTSDGSVQKYGFKVTGIDHIYDLSKATITAATSAVYTGSAIIPASIVVKIGATTLKNNKDYTLTVSNNVNVGTATIKVTGKAPSKGSKTKTFQIMKRTPGQVTKLAQKSQNASSATISWSPVAYASGYYVYKYDASKKKYTLYQTLTGGNKTSCVVKGKAAQDMKVSVSAFIKGHNWTTTSKEVYKTISTLPAKVKSCKATYKAGATITWKALSGVKGYQIYMATAKKGKYKLVQTVKKGSAKSVKLAKAKIGKKKGTRYFKIRAYRSGAGKTLYGEYSSIFNVKVK